MAQHPIPSTRVISPSPDPSDTAKDEYFPPTTRSKVHRVSSVEPIDEDPDLYRARSRSRSPHLERRSARGMNGVVSSSARAGIVPLTERRKRPEDVQKSPDGVVKGESVPNGLLSPDSAVPKQQQGFGSAYWRNLSRSPSPFGLIPIHREWRAFVHKHEVPRKVLHVSIGFGTLWLYRMGAQISQIHPVLLSLLIPIFTVDVIRFRWPAFNRVYIKYLGAFMRESEAHDRFNGVISYLAGLWATMYFCKKDVAVMSVLLLSWCDTAASTFGRQFGKYTPRIRKGKSLAGSLAACAFGIASAVLFWGLIAPMTPRQYNEGVHKFAFEGTLTLPTPAREFLGLSESAATISGYAALGVLAVISGLVASVSEAIDIFGLDDNLTIPILSGIGLGAFLWAFASG